MAKHQVNLTDKQLYNLIAGMTAGLRCGSKNVPYSNSISLPDDVGNVSEEVLDSCTTNPAKMAYIDVEAVCPTDYYYYPNYEHQALFRYEKAWIVPILASPFPSVEVDYYVEEMLGFDYKEFETKMPVEVDLSTFKVYVKAEAGIKDASIVIKTSEMTIPSADQPKIDSLTAGDTDGYTYSITTISDYVSIVNITLNSGATAATDVLVGTVRVADIQITPEEGTKNVFRSRHPHIKYDYQSDVKIYDDKDLDKEAWGYRLPPIKMTVHDVNDNELKYYGTYQNSQGVTRQRNWGVLVWFNDTIYNDPEHSIVQYSGHNFKETETTVASPVADKEYDERAFYEDAWIYGTDDYMDALRRYGYAHLTGTIYSEVEQLVKVTVTSEDGSFEYTGVWIELAAGDNEVDIKIPLYNTEESFTGNCVIRIDETYKDENGSATGKVFIRKGFTFEISTVAEAPAVIPKPLGKDIISFYDFMEVEVETHVDTDIKLEDEISIEDEMDITVDVPIDTNIKLEDTVEIEDEVDVEATIAPNPNPTLEDEVEIADEVDVDVVVAPSPNQKLEDEIEITDSITVDTE